MNTAKQERLNQNREVDPITTVLNNNRERVSSLRTNTLNSLPETLKSYGKPGISFLQGVGVLALTAFDVLGDAVTTPLIAATGGWLAPIELLLDLGVGKVAGLIGVKPRQEAVGLGLSLGMIPGVSPASVEALFRLEEGITEMKNEYSRQRTAVAA